MAKKLVRKTVDSWPVYKETPARQKVDLQGLVKHCYQPQLHLGTHSNVDLSSGMSSITPASDSKKCLHCNNNTVWLGRDLGEGRSHKSSEKGVGLEG